MAPEKPKWTRCNTLQTAGLIATVGAGVWLEKTMRSISIDHPDNNKPLGDKITSKSERGYRARLVTSTEALIDGSDVVLIQGSIKSGEDILSPLFKESFRAGSGIHIRGGERLLGMEWGNPRLVVVEEDLRQINYIIPPIAPGLRFNIFKDAGLVRDVTVTSYSHPMIGLTIAYRDLSKIEPDVQLAPVKP